ncbi:hypothetical protein [Pseudonocardia aurantiaca]|uniref:Uncharacterized protein n=1 Tax=Pseudonocardia aurantiaca TaxID=75290 RepID=A0ABW4FU82_9PSEU
MIPRAARPELITRPWSMICWARSLAMSPGIANPIPAATPPMPWFTAATEGMPTTLRSRLTSGPPLLPGLIGALVWIV